MQEIWEPLINIIFLSVPFAWYMAYQLYKDCKKKDEIIQMLTNAYLRKHGEITEES